MRLQLAYRDAISTSVGNIFLSNFSVGDTENSITQTVKLRSQIVLIVRQKRSTSTLENQSAVRLVCRILDLLVRFDVKKELTIDYLVLY